MYIYIYKYTLVYIHRKAVSRLLVHPRAHEARGRNGLPTFPMDKYPKANGETIRLRACARLEWPNGRRTLHRTYRTSETYRKTYGARTPTSTNISRFRCRVACNNGAQRTLRGQEGITKKRIASPVGDDAPVLLHIPVFCMQSAAQRRARERKTTSPAQDGLSTRPCSHERRTESGGSQPQANSENATPGERKLEDA